MRLKRIALIFTAGVVTGAGGYYFAENHALPWIYEKLGILDKEVDSAQKKMKEEMNRLKNPVGHCSDLYHNKCA